jgi:hypothetical protein
MTILKKKSCNLRDVQQDPIETFESYKSLKYNKPPIYDRNKIFSNANAKGYQKSRYIRD